ncbi:heavy metal transporter [Salinisphaera orenii MK-B5]|uniref:Heavy metal transporter n=2 Tax=Salinisphaera orenii TaxID=856731 RepID=A0A423PY76_9GAMM|nr:MULTISPECIES: cation transporter [Salinisphaera]ROO23120.1 heavy metal transporter [Salinisphaera halophila YIM 95161]ROO30531.1 heavy metal transporter [Salinisphaera orenii MK-B5]
MIRLQIEGMSCGHCVSAVRDALAGVAGVDRVAAVDLEAGEAAVEGRADTQALIAAVEEAGYTARAA